MAHRDGLEIFIQVAQTGSFRKAALALGLTPPAVSNAMSRLEERLKSKLVQRNTRGLQLTDEGRIFLQRIQPALREIIEAEADTREAIGRARGRLRVTAPEAFGRLIIAPALPAFLAAFPEVQVEILNTDRVADLLHEGFDVGIRFGPLADSTFVSRVLWRNRRVTVAAPSYLENAANLASPDDLKNHRCLGFGPSGIPPMSWRFRAGDQPVEIQPAFQLVGNQIDSLIAVAAAGGGVLQVLDSAIQRELADGTLRVVLAELSFEDRPILLVWPGQRHLPAKTRAFLDWIGGAVAPPEASAAPMS